MGNQYCNCLNSGENQGVVVNVPPLNEEEVRPQGEVHAPVPVEKKTPRGVNNPSQSIRKKPSSSNSNQQSLNQK